MHFSSDHGMGCGAYFFGRGKAGDKLHAQVLKIKQLLRIATPLWSAKIPCGQDLWSM